MSNESDRNDGTSHKRPLENGSEGEQFSFIVSQEPVGADDEDHKTVSSSSNKRQRMMDPDSPGVVSISSAVGHSASSSVPWILNDVLEQQQQQPNEWWKQKPNSLQAALSNGSSPMDINTTDTTTTTAATTQASPCCFICQRPFQERQQTQYEHQEVKASNSLLSYFPCTTKQGFLSPHTSTASVTAMCTDVKPAPLAAAATVDAVRNNKCSFCDRQACVSCTRSCEQCQQTFCSLCSMTDYSGRLERTFCLDCHAMRIHSEDDDDDDANKDDMHIG